MRYALPIIGITAALWYFWPTSNQQYGNARLVTEISTAQEEYKKKSGHYLQTLTSSRLPHYESGTIEQKLGRVVPENIRIDVYRTPDGQEGYQIVEIAADGTETITAFGPEASERTGILKPADKSEFGL